MMTHSMPVISAEPTGSLFRRKKCKRSSVRRPRTGPTILHPGTSPSAAASLVRRISVIVSSSRTLLAQRENMHEPDLKQGAQRRLLRQSGHELATLGGLVADQARQRGTIPSPSLMR